MPCGIDEDYPETNMGGGGGNYRRRTDERGNYGSPQQSRQPRPTGNYERGMGQQQSMVAGQTKFKESLWKLGSHPVCHRQPSSLSQSACRMLTCEAVPIQDYDPLYEIPQLAEEVESWFFKEKPVVFLAFRAAYVSVSSAQSVSSRSVLTVSIALYSVSELPHKLHHYASLLAHLSLKAITPPVSLAARLSNSSAPPSYSAPSAPGLPSKPVSAIDGEQSENHGENNDEVKREDTGNDEEREEAKVNVGKEIVEDLMKAFQAFLDERKWKSVRYCVSPFPARLLDVNLLTFRDLPQVTLFAQLTSIPLSAPLVAPTSLMTLLSSFLSVLDEPGLRLSRGDECVRIIVEALLRLEGGDEGAFQAAGGLETLKEGIQGYVDARKVGKDAFADEETKEQWVDVSLPSLA